MPKTFLTARWHDLAMVNYEVDPELLRRHVPRGVELDFHEGRTFVSLVGFQFLDTKLLGLPVPFHRDFEEVNLRFYVRRQGPEGWRRGVVFVREYVPRMAIATVAKAVYNEPYQAVPMRNVVDAGQVTYSWQREAKWNAVRLDRSGLPAEAVAGSVEEFITEHYWGYCAQRDGGTVEYRVEHPRWRVWRAAGVHLDFDVGQYGDDFASTLAAPPASAFVADGSATAVLSANRL